MTTTSSPPMASDTEAELDHGRGARAGLAFLRVAIGLLWIQNVAWKIPPDFGEEIEGGLFKYASYAVDYPVLAPYSWLTEQVILPNIAVFGYMTLLAEASLGAFLLVGLATRFWALVGMAQTVAITLSVLNAPEEWHWSYYLMFAAHAVLLTSAAGRTAGLDAILRPRWRASTGRVSQLLLRMS